ncbi:hypothetical protein PsYK624_132340 [Phanerochaete sordida]|uniref:DUF6534 domain-containing protein n=1 Tax=Phanerochaete sordida TaxID=48140 RepID=A0A9P3GPB3_9APHY|nr:hypothetical protein PsYK624_132340 [Phanerochaete sordida]
MPTDLAAVAGPVLLGSLFNWGLYGVLCVQVYLYHLAFPHDGWGAKALVYGVFALDSAQTCIVTGDVFTTYARHYGDVAELWMQHNEWLAVPVFSSLVSCTVQMYYAYRIGHLARSKALRLGISLLALLQGVAGIATGVQSAIIRTFEELEAKAHSATILWLAGSAACDVLIAGTMAWLLLHKDTRSAATRARITRLVHIVVETGSLTAAGAVLVLVLYVALPARAYYAAVGAVLGKLYSNALLVLFNSRMRVAPVVVAARDEGSARVRAKAALGFGRRSASRSGDLGGVHVEEQVWVHTDEIQMDHPIETRVDLESPKDADLESTGAAPSM